MAAPLFHHGIIERKAPELPRFIVIPAAKVAPWNLPGTTVVEGFLNGAGIGRRTLKRWDAQGWFIEVTKEICASTGTDTGSTVELELRLASATLPQELADVIAASEAARTVWESLSASQQRMLREEIAAGKQSSTRRRRVEKALLPRPEGSG